MGVSRVSVVGLAKGLLRDLPIALDHLGHVSLDIAAGQIPPLEVVKAIAGPLLERFSRQVRVDEHEALPCRHLDFRKLKLACLDSIAECRKVPVCWGLLEGSVEFPGKAMERASDLIVAVPVEVLELTSAM